jgi:uncharacterized repeat protein (TIGR01451 family)
MRRNYRLAGYLLAAVVLVELMASGPQAWATPDQTSSQQTVPTRTPKPPAPKEDRDPPTATPAITPTTVATASPTARATGTPIPRATPTPTATGVPLSLTVRANPSRVWAGLPVEYTLTLVNRSTNPVRNVLLLDALPVALEPGGIISGTGAAWQDRTLRIEKDELKPGELIEVVFQAIVADNVPPGTTIANQVDAVAEGGLQAKASAVVTLPPAELPRVGGSCDADR